MRLTFYNASHYEQFLLFPQCFQKTCTRDTYKSELVWERANSGTHTIGAITSNHQHIFIQLWPFFLSEFSLKATAAKGWLSHTAHDLFYFTMFTFFFQANYFQGFSAIPQITRVSDMNNTHYITLFLSAWLFSKKTQGIAIALAASSSLACKNCDILSYLCHY